MKPGVARSDTLGVPGNELQSRILCWVLRLVTFLKTLPRDYITAAMARQLVRSGTSIGANYTEAQCGASRRDFANFVRHALKSARESEYWLIVLSQTTPLSNSTELRWLQGELNQVVRMLYAITIKTTNAPLLQPDS